VVERPIGIGRLRPGAQRRQRPGQHFDPVGSIGHIQEAVCAVCGRRSRGDHGSHGIEQPYCDAADPAFLAVAHPVRIVVAPHVAKQDVGDRIPEVLIQIVRRANRPGRIGQRHDAPVRGATIGIVIVGGTGGQSGRIDPHLIVRAAALGGRQAFEVVFAVGVRDRARNHRRAVRVSQFHAHAGNSRFARILNRVAVLVAPDRIPDDRRGCNRDRHAGGVVVGRQVVGYNRSTDLGRIDYAGIGRVARRFQRFKHYEDRLGDIGIDRSDVVPDDHSVDFIHRTGKDAGPDKFQFGGVVVVGQRHQGQTLGRIEDSDRIHAEVRHFHLAHRAQIRIDRRHPGSVETRPFDAIGIRPEQPSAHQIQPQAGWSARSTEINQDLRIAAIKTDPADIIDR